MPSRVVLHQVMLGSKKYHFLCLAQGIGIHWQQTADALQHWTIFSITNFYHINQSGLTYKL